MCYFHMQIMFVPKAFYENLIVVDHEIKLYGHSRISIENICTMHAISIFCNIMHQNRRFKISVDKKLHTLHHDGL